MKILTLFLALFLTLLSESAPFADCSLGQDSCLEQVDYTEEGEAVIRTSQTQQKQIQACSEPVFEVSFPESSLLIKYHPVHLCFEKQWLRACALRL